MKELLNCQNATVSHHSFDSIALDREMQGSGSNVGAISCLSVEKSHVTGLANHSTSIIEKVSANLCKKSILKYNLTVLFTAQLMIERCKGLAAKAG